MSLPISVTQALPSSVDPTVLQKSIADAASTVATPSSPAAAINAFTATESRQAVFALSNLPAAQQSDLLGEFPQAVSDQLKAALSHLHDLGIGNDPLNTTLMHSPEMASLKTDNLALFNDVQAYAGSNGMNIQNATPDARNQLAAD